MCSTTAVTSGNSTYTLELPYRRSVGAVVGAFLTALREGRVVGSRTAGGRVLVPPLEYDPDTGDAADEIVEVGTTGTVTSWAWVGEPLPKHPLDHPFAWVLVRLDGADTSLLHVLDGVAEPEVATGMRVRLRWAEARTGHITDIAGFEPDGPVSDVHEAAPPTDEPSVQFMRQHIALEYALRLSPLARRFGDQLQAGRIVGQRCPSCGRVFVPPRAFCPICVVAMAEDDEVELAHTGTVTSFTVLTPIQYHGQKERDDYALATVLIDGADGTVGQQRLIDVPLDQVRTGLRVEAEWAPPDERGGQAGDRGYGFGNAIRGWRPTGEPDVPSDEFAEHVL
jgi:uncharacterized protein